MSQPDSNSTRPLVEVNRLNVRFGNQHVLRDVDLTIARGETVALIGESGCGKTVLMKTIIGLQKPTSGKVKFDGRDLSSLTADELARTRTRFGFVFQNAALFDSMTIGQNVAFPLRQHKKLDEAELRRRVLTRLAEVGLPDTIVTKKPAQLSGGMRKRVGMARALIMDPEIILYDEPTTGLDPIMSDVINELMLHARSHQNITGLVVTHDMRTACKVADRVVMVYPVARLQPNEPQILFDGPPDALEKCSDPRVVQFVNGDGSDRIMELRGTA